MEGAFAASRGAPGGWSCLEFERNKELMCGRRVNVCGPSSSDRSRLQCHGPVIRCGKNNKLEKQNLKPLNDGFLSDKKKIKLLDVLSKDLSILSNSLTQSNGVPSADDACLADQVRGRILSDALEVIMTQLAQVKAERKEKKRQLKAQKKTSKARKDGTSSSSPESVDCEREVADGSQIRRTSLQERPMTVRDPRTDSRPRRQAPAILTENLPEGVGGERGLRLEFIRGADKLEVSEVVPGVASHPGGQIQVCTGPKCTKMGSGQLLAAFVERIRTNGGFAVEVVGCKCLGKCRNAPNVKVQGRYHVDGLGWSQLHSGVGTGDVDSIVSHHFGEQLQGGALVPA